MNMVVHCDTLPSGASEPLEKWYDRASVTLYSLTVLVYAIKESEYTY